MATVSDKYAEVCASENTNGVDENHTEDTFSDGLNIDSFIDEEFANLFDSESDLDDQSLFEDCAPSCSNSSRILAQQLQKLKQSNMVDNGGSTDEIVAVERAHELEHEQGRENQAGSERLQAGNSNSLDSGIGDGHKEELGQYNISTNTFCVSALREVYL